MGYAGWQVFQSLTLHGETTHFLYPRCWGLNAWVPPKSQCWYPSPRRCWCQEVEPLGAHEVLRLETTWMGWVFLHKDPMVVPCLLRPVRTQWGVLAVKWEEGHHHIWPGWWLNLNLASISMRIISDTCKPPSLWCYRHVDSGKRKQLMW